MFWFWVVVTFILGSMIGSFLNVCIYRLPRDKVPWRPVWSYCPHCHETIAWYDNIPLVSYFALRRQCRQCGSPISPRYVLVEFLTAVMFALTYGVLRARGEGLEGLPVSFVYMALTGVLIMASFMDIELRIIPNVITIGGILLAPVLSAFIPELHHKPLFGRVPVFWVNDALAGSLAACGVGMAVGAGVTWLAGVLGKLIFRREAMGLGDVKFMAMLGGLLGWKLVLMVFFVGPLFGAVFGVIHLARTREHHIPFGPFLSVGAVVAMLLGDKVLFLLGIAPILPP